MPKRLWAFIAVFLLILTATYGENPTAPPERSFSWSHHLELKNSSIFKQLKWELVGPHFTGGRISSIASPMGRPFTIYVGVGSGGLWKTTNNGNTWQPLFDNYPTVTVGAVAISPQNPKEVWIGTGEDLMARSSYAGTGVYKSEDGGATWKYMGLSDTHHINRIVIDPINPKVVYVAAMGHLYTKNKERGLFKTEDGGKTWRKVLYINESTGCTDVVIDPIDHNTIYAAMWEFDRKAWHFKSSGPGSGIFKSEDGGKTWKKLTNGLPIGKYVGRIGIAIAPSNHNVIYAVIDNQAPRKEKKKGKKSGLSILDIMKMTKEEFLKIDIKALEKLLRDSGVSKEYSSERVINMVKNEEITPRKLGEYLLNLWEDRKLHVSNVTGAEVYRSKDGGKTWEKMNIRYLDIFHTYGYSFCDIKVSPDNENEIYVLGIWSLHSTDGGKTFKLLTEGNVHADHHDLWIDPNNPDRLILGTDGGLYFSYDRGRTWKHINNLPIIEFYAISFDMQKPYYIYGGTQDNGSLYGPSTYVFDYQKSDPWKPIAGGDGFFVFTDPINPNIVYCEYQFGNILRKDMKTKKIKNIMPKSKLGEPPLRHNWMTPFIISHHNPFILYYGANKLFKSFDRGDHWYCISPDLTMNSGPEKRGNIPYRTITTISESPLKPGLIYVGTDNGNVYVTKNDGVTWEKINEGLPSKWVSRVVASKYKEGRVYLTLTGYREDDFNTYVYRSDDYGRHWVSIVGNLPNEPVNVIREDPDFENVLYLGTDLGAYVSLNGGKSWISICNNLPTVAVYDLAIHPREKELIAGTHGRSAYILDIKPIHEYIKKHVYEKDAYLFSIKPAKLPSYSEEFGKSQGKPAMFYYWLKNSVKKVKIQIYDSKGKLIKELKGPHERGINLAIWDLKLPIKKYPEQTENISVYVKPETYKVKVLIDRKTILEGNITVK